MATTVKAILICVTAVGHLNIQAARNIHVLYLLVLLRRIGQCCFEFGRTHYVLKYLGTLFAFRAAAHTFLNAQISFLLSTFY